MDNKRYNFKCVKGKGNYYRTHAFHYTFIAIIIIPLLLGAAIVLLNPFWFRSPLISKFNKMVERITDWRYYKEYKIYLGTDPELWHMLKD